MISCTDQADLSAHNTLALPCIARQLLKISTLDELIQVNDTLNFKHEKRLILGGGSNLLLPPFLDRTVLQYSGKSVTYDQTETGETLVEAEAGVLWDDLVKQVVAKNLRGLENLSLIPGTVGAAPVQNIGAYGVELADVLEWVQVYEFANSRVLKLTKEQCRFGYRDSLFKQQPNDYFIVKIGLRLSENRPFSLLHGELKSLTTAPEVSPADVRHKVCALRQMKLPDPAVLPNVGSFFKNPLITAAQLNALLAKFPKLVYYPVATGLVKIAAAWLIEDAGWKGRRSGAVGVHQDHALVLVNYGDATREQLLDLASQIQNSISARFQVALEIEPVLID